jgi:hypothetical protein
MAFGMSRWVCALVGVGCALVWAAPARADEPKVTSGVAAGNADSAQGGKAEVSVRSTGAPVTVAVIVDRAVGVGNVGGSTATIVTVRYQDICKAPCSFEMDPGLRELVVYGDGVSGASKKLELKPGPQAFVVKPGSSAAAISGYLLTVLGGVSLVVGVTVLAVDSKSSIALPMTIGGGVGLGGGIALWMIGSTSFESDPNASPAQRAASKPLGVSLAGSF